jgi:uncharacterized protein YegL
MNNLAFKRTFPIIILADCSGSMGENGKIQSLNNAIREMIEELNHQQTDADVEIKLSVIQFGGKSAEVIHRAVDLGQFIWKDLSASGGTPMGDAFSKTLSLVENTDTIPKNAYAPMIILVSDGLPTDIWDKPLANLIDNIHIKKGKRFAMAIGPDADDNLLQKFSSEALVFKATDVSRIKFFFQYITMYTSITMGGNYVASTEAIEIAGVLTMPQSTPAISTKTTRITNEESEEISTRLGEIEEPEF